MQPAPNRPTSPAELHPDELVKLAPDRLAVRVRSITYAAENINLYEVVDPHGGELPPFTAGSHIDLCFRDLRIRQYSLCNSPMERHRYVFAVQFEPQGRGGSKTIFERVHVGRTLVVSAPRNHFQLARDAQRHLFIAGGIGITPIMAMIHALRASGGEFELHYCTRSAERTAFLDDLAPEREAGRAIVYHDGGDPARGLDLQALLRVQRPGTHVYCCGPQPFMRAVREASAQWPRGSVHFEYFAPDDAKGAEAATAPPSESSSFQVRLARSGVTIDVPGNKSILESLRDHGYDVASSCESGCAGPAARITWKACPSIATSCSTKTSERTRC